MNNELVNLLKKLESKLDKVTLDYYKKLEYSTDYYSVIPYSIPHDGKVVEIFNGMLNIKVTTSNVDKHVKIQLDDFVIFNGDLTPEAEPIVNKMKDLYNDAQARSMRNNIDYLNKALDGV